MSGILFCKTRQPDILRQFYTEVMNCEIWLEQIDCTVFRHGNFLFGFCKRDKADTEAMLTFFYDSRDEVDRMYEKLKSRATGTPSASTKYRIYQFFAEDPEGRPVNCQHFEHPIAGYRSGDDLLLSRRSIRRFTDQTVDDNTLQAVLELARFAPTARNTQSYYFKLIYDRETLEWLSSTREASTGPIARAPMAVAICADPKLSGRYVQDGCIAAYHFILAAWFHGLGTCWIAAMDRDDVKERLDIPGEHYIATITPLGYPQDEVPPAPERKERAGFVRK